MTSIGGESTRLLPDSVTGAADGPDRPLWDRRLRALLSAVVGHLLAWPSAVLGVMGHPLFVLYSRAAIVSLSEEVLRVSTLAINETTLCCRKDAEKCRVGSWCNAQKGVQRELSNINLTMQVSVAFFGILSLAIWPMLWQNILRWCRVDFKWALCWADTSTWFVEVAKVIIACSASRYSHVILELVWGTPVISFMTGGGPMAYTALRDAAIASNVTMHGRRSVLYVLFPLVIFPAAAAGNFLVSRWMSDGWIKQSMCFGLAGYASGILLQLLFRWGGPLPGMIRSGSPERTNQENSTITWLQRLNTLVPLYSEAWSVSRAEVCLLLASVLYNPLSTSIASPFVEQYVSERYGTTKSEASDIKGVASFCGLPPLLLALWHLLTRSITAEHAIAEWKNITLALTCLVVAMLGGGLMAWGTSVKYFAFGLCMMTFGIQYIIFDKPALLSQASETRCLGLVTLEEIAQAIGRAVAGLVLYGIFARELDESRAGSTYAFVTLFSAAALLLLIYRYCLSFGAPDLYHSASSRTEAPEGRSAGTDGVAGVTGRVGLEEDGAIRVNRASDWNGVGEEN